MSHLGSRVWVGGLKSGVLIAAILAPNTGFTVDLISGDCDETLDAAVHPGSLQQDVCPVGVVHCEGQRVAKGVVNMGLHRHAHGWFSSGSRLHACRVAFYSIVYCETPRERARKFNTIQIVQHPGWREYLNCAVVQAESSKLKLDGRLQPSPELFSIARGLIL